MAELLISPLFDHMPIGAYRTTPDGVLLRANQALVRMNGYETESEWLAATQASAEGWYVDPSRRAVFRSIMHTHGVVTNFVSEVYRRSTGERIWVRETAYGLRDESGKLILFEGTVEDITDSVLAQQTLEDREARWRLALEAAGDGVWDWHIATGEEYCSDGLLRMFGYEPGELLNNVNALDERTHPDDLRQMAIDREAHLSGRSAAYVNEHRVQCKDGTWKWVLSRGMVIERDAEGRPTRMIGTHTDISQRKQSEALIWRQAHVDSLTGLPNRRMVRQQLDEAMSDAARQGHSVVVAFIDLDHFKQVNDTLGHDQGDLLLVQAAQRISSVAVGAVTVARMGGDEFTVVLKAPFDTNQPNGGVQPVLDGILSTLSTGFDLKGQTVFVSASIGVARYPEDAQVAEDLMKHADQALYVAKGSGRNRCCFFEPAMQAAAQLRARLDADLRQALPRAQFEVVYQPIVELASGRVRKAEALLRWHHPTLGAVSPADFIPIAEMSGLIVPIGDWVFEQSVGRVKAWREQFDAGFQISVNKSPVQFHQAADHTERWLGLLSAHALPGSAVAIEITETLLLDMGAQVTGHLADLRDAGVDVSLDDFGTGYSSLSYLQKLDIDFIKIDQTFVRNLKPDSTAFSLCKAIVMMAHELGMQVVAEGVETQEQRDLLLAAGCDFAQGYWFARPMSVAAIEDWLRGVSC